MKKYFSNKQLAIAIITLMALIFATIFTLNFCMPTVAYAYGESANGDEIYYAASGRSVKETESFSYATKTTESYYINPTFPDYYNVNGELLNTCPNVAGANILGYYDRYFDDLIPDYTTGISAASTNNIYTYYPMGYFSAKKQAVINDLYIRMQTNVNAAGSTKTQYNNGLSSYVQNIGYSMTYNSVITNGAFDLAKAKTQFQNGNPISLFLLGYNITKVTDDGSKVTLTKDLCDDNHIVIAYGYEKVSYFDSNGKAIKTEIYLRVSSGIVGVSGVYVVNKYGTLYDAEAAHIS